MVFSSLKFIFIFLPVFLLVYYLCPTKAKNAVILLGSVAFYVVGALKQPFHILLFLVMVAINYFLGILLDEETSQRKRKAVFAFGLVLDFFWLILFKYLDFILSGLNGIAGADFIKLPHFVLPLGISFYTFQMVSYLADVYGKKEVHEKSLLRFAVYICMFPQLIAGPIVTYGQVKDQLKAERKFKFEWVKDGVAYFIVGLGLKVLIANQMGSLWEQIKIIGADCVSTPMAWLGIFGFSFQIYFDFWGYSLMAVGLGKLMGIELPRNFDNPYTSVTMTEFWRRWHITLGKWFREYVYIPLGGSHTTKAKWVRNLFIVWLFTGIWHGAGWNFIMWGLSLFLIILMEKLFLGKVFNKVKILGHLYMLFLIPLSWALFAITDLQMLKDFFAALFPFARGVGQNVFAGDFVKYVMQYKFTLAAAVVFSLRFPGRIFEKIRKSTYGVLFLIPIFWGAVYCLYKGMNDPFLYFRF